MSGEPLRAGDRVCGVLLPDPDHPEDLLTCTFRDGECPSHDPSLAAGFARYVWEAERLAAFAGEGERAVVFAVLAQAVAVRENTLVVREHLAWLRGDR